MLFVADDGSVAPAPVVGADAPRSQDETFSVLYRRHFGDVVKLCRRYLGNDRDAEAVAQEAFLRVWRARERFESGRAFWPWVATIARRLCLNELGRRPTGEASDLDMAVDPTTIDDHLSARVVKEDVAAVFGHLSSRQRRLLYLRDVEGWSYEDIAAMDGCTIEGVRSSLKRARAMFRKLYEGMARTLLGGFPLLRRASDWVRRSGGWTGPDLVAAVVGVLLCGGAPVATPTAPETAPFAVAATVAPSMPSEGPVVARSAAPSRDRGRPTGLDARASDGASLRRLEENVEFTPSPSYERDRTVFATGTSTRCDGPETTLACPVLYKSTDGGASWSRLPAKGRTTGTLLLPPAYPRDNRIFSAGGSHLFVSEDDGATFRPIVAVHGNVVMSPLFSDGDARFLISTPSRVGPPLEYRDGDAVARPLSLPLDADVLPQSVLFAPSYATDGRLLVVALGLGHGSLLPSPSLHLYSCTPGECTRVVDDVTPHVFVSRDAAKVYATSTPVALVRSVDGGASFEPVPLPAEVSGSILSEVTEGADGALFVETFEHSVLKSRLHRSYDGGSTWTVLPWSGPVMTMLLPLPDGRLLASSEEGLACSDDGGATWAPSCPRPH